VEDVTIHGLPGQRIPHVLIEGGNGVFSVHAYIQEPDGTRRECWVMHQGHTTEESMRRRMRAWVVDTYKTCNEGAAT
jgi:hypothetical protein